MKKRLIIILTILCLTGCGEKKEIDPLLGTWETSYELGAFGVVSESYEFKENGECIQSLNAGSTITTECTYQLNDEKTEIKIVWKDKNDKDSYVDYSLNNDELKIGTRTYTRK